MPSSAAKDSAEILRCLEAGTPKRPFVIAQLGQSLDGRIATVTGDSKYINGSAALDHLHRLRAAVDVVVVGIGTVLADDPQLSVRRVSGRNPARAVIDPRGRLPAEARCVAGNGAPCLVICGEDAAVRPGMESVRVPADAESRLCPRAILRALGARGFGRILIEGGSRTISTFLAEGCLDRLHVLVAPVLIGSGQPGLELRPIHLLKDALRPETRAHLLGSGEVLFDCDLRTRARVEEAS
jgi:diaminohydroxyphosphoribosylaminopyrimidine deaminase / 5-amino-6-(5-phosphoribosylamino)uracil reductase